MKSQKQQRYGNKEAEQRFEAALRGAFKTAPSPKTVTPKKPEAQQLKGKPAKASPSGAPRASAKTGRP
jgi:hypothetical protein